MTMTDEDTKYGHLADIGEDDDRTERDEEPNVEVCRHTVVIDDESEEAERRDELDGRLDEVFD